MTELSMALMDYLRKPGLDLDAVGLDLDGGRSRSQWGGWFAFVS